jgi:ATP-dependent helicase/nuclease subunit B
MTLSPEIRVIAVAGPGELLAVAAAALVELAAAKIPDLAHARVLLPSLHAGVEFRHALLRASGRPVLLLPRIGTYHQLGGDDTEAALHDSARAAWLYGALRSRGWFDDASRWAICRELGALFDELTARNLALPRDLAQFRDTLRAAYDSGVRRGVDFEARLVYELWFALEASGTASPAARRKLKLAALAANARGPLVAVTCEKPEPELEAFCSAWASREAVTLVQFAPEQAVTGVTALLQQAWPPAEGSNAGATAPPPLRERARALRGKFAASPLVGRLKLAGCADAEQEATSAALTIRGWLEDGAKQIAVVTLDRLAARRLRALLERSRILVADEAGWKLSTTSAATVISRWLDCVAEGFYHRDLLDLLKSPFTLSDIERGARRELVHLLEKTIRSANIIEGMDAIAAALRQNGAPAGLDAIVDRLRNAAQAQLPRARERASGVPLGAWLLRLDQALQILGIAGGLAQDAAGRQLLELLLSRGEALAGDRQVFAFHEWRRWLNGELEAATFRDTGISSPVAFTQLGASRLRRFDKVLILGADTLHLPGPLPATRFFNQRVRASLGLPTAEAAAETLRRDLISLLALASEVRVSWQARRNGEPMAPGPLIDVLQTLHAQAFGDELRAANPGAWLPDEDSAGDSGLDIGAEDREAEHIASPRAAPRPSAPGLLPQRLTASAYASLVACPYQFFARHMLRLNEADEVEEQIGRRDFGEAVHAILKAFHEQVPEAGALADAEALALLNRLGETIFAPLRGRNPLAAAYQAEWEAIAPHYLEWQRGRESAGWMFESAETRREQALDVAGAPLTFHGRFDRIDVRADGGRAVLDYKTRDADLLKKRAQQPGEDVQLESYALLLGGAGAPAELAYVALERGGVSAVPHRGDPAEAALRTAGRVIEVIAEIRAGAGLPAQGAAGVCMFCEARGLCRRDYWERS